MRGDGWKQNKAAMAFVERIVGKGLESFVTNGARHECGDEACRTMRKPTIITSTRQGSGYVKLVAIDMEPEGTQEFAGWTMEPDDVMHLIYDLTRAASLASGLGENDLIDNADNAQMLDAMMRMIVGVPTEGGVL